MTENQQINNTEAPVSETKKKSNTVLWVMMILFVLPYIAAFYFYFNRGDLNLGMGSNYGTIITPVRQLPDRDLLTLGSEKLKLSSLKGKWVILSIGSSACQKDCVDNLYKMRQIKKAVGQEYKRISKLFFLRDQQNIESFKSLLNDYPDMEVIVPSGDGYEAYLSHFLYEGIDIENSLFIIDPLGNYMMVYPEGADASKILKDIERLLEISKIG